MENRTTNHLWDALLQDGFPKNSTVPLLLRVHFCALWIGHVRRVHLSGGFAPSASRTATWRGSWKLFNLWLHCNLGHHLAIFRLPKDEIRVTFQVFLQIMARKFRQRNFSFQLGYTQTPTGFVDDRIQMGRQRRQWNRFFRSSHLTAFSISWNWGVWLVPLNSSTNIIFPNILNERHGVSKNTTGKAEDIWALLQEAQQRLACLRIVRKIHKLREREQRMGLSTDRTQSFFKGSFSEAIEDVPGRSTWASASDLQNYYQNDRNILSSL